MGYSVEHGFYRGASTRIGNDGLWRSADFDFVLEVKTSDLSIKLDTIAGYRTRLIEASSIAEKTSSILIVLGRQDTGDLEAQIRGSKHAWDIRMIGIDSLFRLLDIKENLNDPRSINQITELLKPIEYTRVDRLIDVVFYTSCDLSTPDNPEVPDEATQTAASALEGVSHDEQELSSDVRTHASPVNFYEKCMARVNQKLGKQFIKNGRVTYTSSDKASNVVLLNSKTYTDQGGQSFWYGFRPNQNDFLSASESSYVAFGCGSENAIILIPFERFKLFIPELGTTRDNTDAVVHSHVVIIQSNSKYNMRVGDRYIDITNYVI